MKRITFNIPSYKRANAPMETLKLFPDARIWVAEFEAENYKKNFPNHEIVVMPDSAQGLWSRARNYLLERMDSDIFYILDDDISSIAEMKGPPKVKWSEINEFSPTVDLVPKIKLPVSGA